MTTEIKQPLLRTALYDCHVAARARLVPFADYEMPVSYAGILDEVRSVRADVGMFDISHMGRVRVQGKGATNLLQRLTTNDVAALAPGRAHYSLLTNEHGGIHDDIIVYRRAEDDYLVVINASNAEKDLAWMRTHLQAGVAIDDQTAETAMIAVQGPAAPALVDGLADERVLDVPRFAFATTRVAGAAATVCRTGYTGEDGFELIVGASDAPAVWRRLLDAGAAPCGLGARDTLRIEAGYPLYGHEIDEETTPVEAALMWAVKLDKGDFVGREAIAAVRKAGAGRKLVGITLAERVAPRQGYTLYAGQAGIGTVTSGTFSPTAEHSVGMAYVADPHNAPGTRLELEVRSQRFPVTVVPKKDLLKS